MDLVSLKQNVDTTLPAGRLTFQVLGAVAEFDRELLRERVKSGMAQVKRAGKHIGRPARRKFHAGDIERMKVLQLFVPGLDQVSEVFPEGTTKRGDAKDAAKQAQHSHEKAAAEQADQTVISRGCPNSTWVLRQKETHAYHANTALCNRNRFAHGNDNRVQQWRQH